MRLTVTTTAMPRPALLQQTYQSFADNLKGVDWQHLRINVDPTTDRHSTLAAIRVGGLFFSQVTSFLPAKASFPLALKRVWGELEGEWILHLEDDWTLDSQIDIQELLTFAEQRPWASQIALRSVPRVNHHQVVLSPSLIKASFAMKAASLLTGTRNPEQELRTFPEFQRCMAYFPFEDVAVVTDTGTEWRQKHGYSRLGECDFTEWKKE